MRSPRPITVFLTVLGAGLLVAWLYGREPAMVAEVGAQAPDFEVVLLDSGSFRLSDHLTGDGRPVILNLWASWCVPCRTEMPALSDFAEANPEILVLGVAVEDTAARASEFAGEIGVAYPLAMGNPDFEAAYPRLGLPVTYSIDSDGVVTNLHNGLIDVETLEELADS